MPGPALQGGCAPAACIRGDAAQRRALVQPAAVGADCRGDAGGRAAHDPHGRRAQPAARDAALLRALQHVRVRALSAGCSSGPAVPPQVKLERALAARPAEQQAAVELSALRADLAAAEARATKAELELAVLATKVLVGGALLAVRRCGGAAVRRCGGAAVRRRGGAAARRRGGAAARRRGGAAARRCGGAAVRRCGGAAVLVVALGASGGAGAGASACLGAQQPFCALDGRR
jgi:hypothetical protein